LLLVDTLSMCFHVISFFSFLHSFPSLRSFLPFFRFISYSLYSFIYTLSLLYFLSFCFLSLLLLYSAGVTFMVFLKYRRIFLKIVEQFQFPCALDASTLISARVSVARVN
jgi:hypothetical protein